MVKKSNPVEICSCSLGQVTRLKLKLEELESATSQMQQSQALVDNLADQAHRYMMGLELEQGFCCECLHNFDTKIELVCNRIDSTTERSGRLSGLSEELWSDKEELFEPCYPDVTCDTVIVNEEDERGHAK